MKNITERAMLVTLSVSQWTARKHDRTASREVAQSHGASGNSDSIGRYNKYLIDKSALKPITKAVNAARKDHDFLTLPWSDDGYRILSAEGYLPYVAKMTTHKDAFTAAVAEFIAGYEDHRTEAEKRLNGLFNHADYPAVEMLRSKFAFASQVIQLPNADDFRVTDLGQSDLEQIKESIENRMRTELAEAAADPWRRIYSALSHMSERLKAYKGGKEGSFRDSLITNMTDLAQVLPALNITGDGELAAMGERLSQEIGKYTAQDLRENEGMREEATTTADDILKSMAGYVG